MRGFVINENDSGQRIDRFITKLMPRLPKSMLYKGLRKRCVKLNGRHVRDGAVFIEEGDQIELYFKDEFFEPDKAFSYIKPRLDIVYEDDNLLIVNKAVGVVSHADERGTAVTLIDMIKSYLYDNNEYDPASEHSFSPSLCNRLDRNTGGLVIAAKNAAEMENGGKSQTADGVANGPGRPLNASQSDENPYIGYPEGYKRFSREIVPFYLKPMERTLLPLFLQILRDEPAIELRSV